ncbi:repeat-containing protein [Ferriphaselus amnicola]|uniref:Repeat-containing protein n=2 Tax=Ferriphaselus amnicola TaxID=1188319 RepID=A0A2Z6GEN4_9PROT|nr:repeat-containing protein [Ferriphaselus amnicola]
MNMPRHFNQRAAVSAMLLCLSLPVGAGDIQDANLLFKQGKQTQALEKVNALLAKDPKDMQARYLKAVIYTQQGRTNDAITIFQSVISDHPNIAEPYNNLGVLHASLGQYEKAKIEFETAIRLKPNYAIAHENLGDLHVKMASTSYGYATDADRGNAKAKDKREQTKSMTSSKPATAAPSLAPAAVAAAKPEAPQPAVVAAAPVAPVVALPVAKPVEPVVVAKPTAPAPAVVAPSKVTSPEASPKPAAVPAPAKPAVAPASTSFWQVLVGSHPDAPAVSPTAAVKSAPAASSPVVVQKAPVVATPAKPVEAAAVAPTKVTSPETLPKPVAATAPAKPAATPSAPSLWQVVTGSHPDAPKAAPTVVAKPAPVAPTPVVAKPAPVVVATAPAKPVEVPAVVVSKPAAPAPAATVQSKAATPAPSIKAAAPVAEKPAAPVAAIQTKPVVVAAPAAVAKPVAADGNAAVLGAVNDWAAAWSSKDAKKYLSFYAKDFATPGGASRVSWESARQQRISKPKFIKVGVDNAKVTMIDSTHATVTFKQTYLSSTLSEVSSKTLTLVKSGDAWLIKEENAGKAASAPEAVAAMPAASVPVKPVSPAPAPTSVVRAPTAALAPKQDASNVGSTSAIRPSMPVLPGSRSRKPVAGSADDSSPVNALRGWATAWSAKDADKYLSFYAKDFTVPGGVPRATWESAREDRISKPKFIHVNVDDVTVTQTDGTHARVTFKQTYKSSSLNQVSRKTMVMVKTADGWQIKEESGK